MEIIELLTPHYDIAWLPWAVQYFFLIGIAACSALIAAGCAFTMPGSATERLLTAAVVVLAVSAIAAPVSLLADLQQPGRFWHFYAHLTPWSWMSLGAVLLPVFVTLALAFCLAWWFNHRGLLRVLGLLLAVSALSVLIYSGSEVMVLKSRPLWSTPFLPINFALTAWLAALGAMLLVARWLPGGTTALPGVLVRRLIWAGIAGTVLAAFAWMTMGMAGYDASFTQAQRLLSEFPAWRWSFLGSIATGIAVILLMSCPPQKLIRPVYSLVASALLLTSGWVFRWIIFMEAQEVPKYGAGLYLYDMPLGSDGLLGMLGVLGLCIALLAVVTWLVSELRRPASVAQPSSMPVHNQPA